MTPSDSLFRSLEALKASAESLTSAPPESPQSGTALHAMQTEKSFLSWMQRSAEKPARHFWGCSCRAQPCEHSLYAQAHGMQAVSRPLQTFSTTLAKLVSPEVISDAASTLAAGNWCRLSFANGELRVEKLPADSFYVEKPK